MGESNRSRVCRRWAIRFGLFLASLYVLLLLPECSPPQNPRTGDGPFIWDRDQFWARLQADFVQARSADKAALDRRIAELLAEARVRLDKITNSAALDPQWANLETNLYQLATLVAAHPERLADFAALVESTRHRVKHESFKWDLTSDVARDPLYTLLFGSRLALEEVLLQNFEAAKPLPVCSHPEPSQTPSTIVRGVKLHSGDVLISRGNAATSALISRGNDYPGAFSHVALLHVDPTTGSARMVQSLIEKGVVITPLEEYFHDHKLRLMVLRPRADLPALQADPQLPHKVATLAYHEAMTRPASYDFEMDYRDHLKLFCSEVASAPYEAHGVRLWTGISHISSPTVSAWLGSVGVRHFETQQPADLEYDPQLRVVAEWREVEALWQAHLDDAVTDVMLENAPPGRPLPFNRWMLPPARIGKLCSVVLNWFGRSGPIPEGLSATAALRMDKYRGDHAALKQRLTRLADDFQLTQGYSPPYWELIRLARDALNARHQ